MKRTLTSAAALSLLATGAMAGGIDRSGQGIDVIFEDGNYLELSFGSVNPTVSGVFTHPLAGPLDSGDMAPTYTQVSLGYKQQINDKFSMGLIVDQPFGANVDYPVANAPYPFAGSTAEINSQAITVLGRYQVSDRFSVHGGVRHQTISGVASIPSVAGYTLDASGSAGYGFVVGGAYEIPDIALRVALTYNSGIDHEMTGTEMGGPTTFDVRTPQSVNLDFQSGIAQDTLMFGSVRWVEWSEFDISPPIYTNMLVMSPLVSYDNDVFTYTLGVGRRFNDMLSGSIALGYEKTQGGFTSNLGPTDGNISLQVGAQYTMDNVKISGGVRYVMIGDATTSSIAAEFTDNTAIGLGMSIGYSF